MNPTILVMLSILLQGAVDDPNRFNDFLVLGYAVMWLIGLAYVISLATRQRNLRQDIHLLHQILQEDEETAE